MLWSVNGSPASSAGGAATWAFGGDTDEPLRPDYGGACLTEVVPTLLRLDALRVADALPGLAARAARRCDRGSYCSCSMVSAPRASPRTAR